MSGEVFVTPLDIVHLYVVESEFKMNGSPAERMEAELGVNLDDEEKPVFERELGCYRLSKTVTVEYGLTDADNPDVRPLHSSVTVLIEATLSSEKEDARAEEFMLTSCVSIAYSHARSCIMSIAAMSPVRELIIPTVNPRMLVRGVDVEGGE